MKPGEYFLESGAITANADCRTTRVLVKNTGDRPVQIGSHYHFFELQRPVDLEEVIVATDLDRALEFDRAAAYGMRLNIAAGTAVRVEPGEEKEVELTEFGGGRVIHGFLGTVGGPLDAAGVRERALKKLQEKRR